MRPDFSLIWGADNAPFTPIEASDYTAGWVFRTGAPPRRVNFDYFQNLSDQRTAWLAGVVDSVRIDVASASTVNLTTAAPDTRGIRITGTTTINGFTAVAGATYLVTFAAALTLTNSASLVTNSGANILTAAGDTCIIRATATNVVEVLCGRFLVERGVGHGQTYQDITGTRTLGVTYTNTSRRTIALSLYIILNASSQVDITVSGGVVASLNSPSGSNLIQYAYLTVPPGATYSAAFAFGSGSISRWVELK